MSHTPGPWRTSWKDTRSFTSWNNEKGVLDHVVYVYRGEDQRIAVYGDNARADAEMIATAPEMLEALEELVDIEGPLPGTANWHAKVMAVIAKARGGDHA